MSVASPLSESQIEPLAILLGDCGSGSDITRVLASLNLNDHGEGYTKWRRLYGLFLKIQSKDGNANRILDFIEKYLAPARYVNRNEQFEGIRTELNVIMAFSGIEYGSDGKFRETEPVSTLNEAEVRANTIRSKLQGPVHPEVLKYCTAELMEDNYFHAAFEASKGLAQRIRDESGIQGDGTGLVDTAFSLNRPLLAFNSLQTETEKTVHKGIATLMRGCFMFVRNPLAHEPKIMWAAEDDVADYFTLISLLHRKLDHCVQVPYSQSAS